MAAPAVKLEADRLGLECAQVADINDAAVAARLRTEAISTLVVAAFGQRLGESLLGSLLCLNVHASLLPAYRGAAPIERALAAGEPCLGVSIMRMTAGLDEGPWALQTSVSVGPRDDADSIGRVLAIAGASGIDQVLTGLADGTITWTEQRGIPTYAAKLGPTDCILRLVAGASEVHAQVRSLSPHVGARAASGGVKFKVWRTWPYGEPGLEPVPESALSVSGQPGRLVASGGRLFIGCGRGAVEVLLIQPAGRNAMSASDFVRGYGVRLDYSLEAVDAAGTRMSQSSEARLHMTRLPKD